MAVFFNQAALSYNGNTVNSNIVSGEIVEVLTATKTAVTGTYNGDDAITYVVSLTNSGALPINGLTVTDNLGEYVQGNLTRVPLDYIDGSLLYYVTGVLQPTPVVAAGTELVISGVNVPAGGNVLLVYQTRANGTAPLVVGGSITNTVTVTGGGLSTPVTASETVTAEEGARLSISKALTPTTVMENGQITYTFVIENRGNTAIVATDNAIVTDAFDPILENIVVSFNGDTWAEGVNYTYNEATGEFATIPGPITVPAATYTQDPVTGVFTVTPGVSVLTVTGTI
ncbi:MAG: hypothetical protein E7417_05840 [Ruminococcaceae bacterium]|nr:hypothetical protein [Oscillospiraceae bacterium]